LAIEILMPRLSDSMEEATILRWLVSEGEPVREGQPLVELETDKASVTYDAEHDGTVLELRAATGESVRVGAVIAVLGAQSPSAADGATAAHGSAATDGVRAPGCAAPDSTTATDDIAATDELVVSTAAEHEGSENGAPSAEEAAVGAEPGRSPLGPVDEGADGRPGVRASPLARRLASQLGVDLGSVRGSGPQGRVVRADIERAAGVRPTARAQSAGVRPTARAQSAGVAPPDAVGARPPTAAEAGPEDSEGAAAIAPAPVPPAGAHGARGELTRLELSHTQRTIARRMAQSRATVPDFELRCQVDMARAAALREQLRGLCDPLPSFNDMVVRASALALREFPRVNASYRDESFEQYSRVNVGIAVAAPDALVVPTIFDADQLSLAQLAEASRHLAARVRDGTITPAELGGGTFTVSNLGMFGIDGMSAVINPPQAAILGVGALRRRPVVDEPSGEIVARETLELTLACDHRILYGADAARFLARVRELLERPLSLLV